ncbi:MAG: hypothetical protein AAF802_33550, partial [Planctomycetota bacterium]
DTRRAAKLRLLEWLVACRRRVIRNVIGRRQPSVHSVGVFWLAPRSDGLGSVFSARDGGVMAVRSPDNTFFQRTEEVTRDHTTLR